MKLKLIETYFDNTEESDYDTAVDLVHYSMNDERYTFELENGLQFIVSNYSTSTSKSYLEPDFDQMEQDFNNGIEKSHYPYEQFASDEKPTYDESLNFAFLLPLEIPVFNIERMQETILLENLDNNEDFYSREDLESYEKCRNSILNNSVYYEMDHPEPKVVHTDFSNETIKEFLNNIPHTIKKGNIYDIEIPATIENNFEKYLKLYNDMVEKNKKNQKNNIDNYELAVDNIIKVNIEQQKLEILERELELENNNIKNIESLHQSINEAIPQKNEKNTLFNKIRKFFR